MYSYEGLALLRRIVVSIRAVIPSHFVLGIKMNASDYVDSVPVESSFHSLNKENQEARALDHICTIARWGGIDFIEVSGGDYESPGIFETSSTSLFILNLSIRISVKSWEITTSSILRAILSKS